MPVEAAATRADLMRRLRCAEGHLRGIAGMIEAGADCQAILRQTRAVQGALAEVNRRLVAHYLNDCLPADMQACDLAVRERMVEEVVALYELVGGRSSPQGGKGTA